MRKTVCYCDFCKKEKKETELNRFEQHEMCNGCMRAVINYVIKNRPMTLMPWCPACKGVGTIVQWTGVDYDRNTYETIKCSDCAL